MTEPIRPVDQAPLVIRRADKVLAPLAVFEYSPSLISALLRRWPEIVCLGLNPFTARGLVRPNVETRDAPKFPAKGKRYHGDGLTWAALVADVERAWMALLGDGSSGEARLRWTIVGYRMAGKKLGEIGPLQGVHVATATVVAQHQQACRAMAETLGYVEPVVNEMLEMEG